MSGTYMIRAKKLVTVTEKGSINDGAMLVKNGLIADIGPWEKLRVEHRANGVALLDCRDWVIAPSLADCHTHLLEFAPGSLFPVTEETHGAAGMSLLLKALSCGITALGEQICGHPKCGFDLAFYRRLASFVPIDVCFSLSSISIGFSQLAHFTAATGPHPVERERLAAPEIVHVLAGESEYPGENLFLNATPANFKPEEVPRAGEIIYEQSELTRVVDAFHRSGKSIGVHVGGEEAIRMALAAGVDVLHHAHGITEQQIIEAAQKNIKIVATPLGGTHELPNSPEQISRLVQAGVTTAISTDAYLPPHEQASWLSFPDRELKGPETLMAIAQPAMKLLQKQGYGENEILSLITRNPAMVLGKEKRYGSLGKGLEANFLVTAGVPGLEITSEEDIRQVYYRGVKVIDRIGEG